MNTSYLPLLLVLCLSAPFGLWAQSYAGTMPTDTIFVCNYNEDLRIQNNGDEALQAGESLNYIITATEDSLSMIYATSMDGVFDWEILLDALSFEGENCNEFFIHALAGETAANGFVDLANPNIDFSDNVQRLVIFGSKPAEYIDDNEDFAQNNDERSESIAAGGCDALPISGGCGELNSSEAQEKSVSCNYELPCLDTLYVTTWDTILPTWYVLEGDTVSAHTSGDTIFTKLLLDTIPEDRMHIDTLIFDNIEQANTNLRVFNAQPFIDPNTHVLIDYQEAVIIGILNEPNKPILDTLIIRTCCSGSLNVIKTLGCGEPSLPIRLTINYGMNEDSPEGGDNNSEDCCENWQPAVSTELICAEDLETYTAIISTEAAYVINGEGNSVTIANIPVGSPVSVTISDPIRGCQKSRTFQAPDCSCLPLPSPMSMGDITICDNGLISALSVSQANVYWDSEVYWYTTAVGGVAIASGTSFTPTEAGTYYAETYELASGCTSERTPISLSISPLPIAAIFGDLNVCPGETLHLTASGGIIYMWNTGEYTASITTGAGQYSVTVTDANSCTDEASIEITTFSSREVAIRGDLNVCPDEQTLLTASGGVSYQWSNFAQSPSIAVSAGTYCVTGTDQNGCQNVACATVVDNGLPTIELIDYSLVCAQDLLSYSLQIQTEPGNELTSSLGIVSGESGFFAIREIPNDIPVTITAIDPWTGCKNTRNFSAPDCDCFVIEPPNTGNIGICEGEILPSLGIFIPNDFDLRWFDVPEAGTPIYIGDTYDQIQAGITYYLEFYDPLTACTSTRSPFSLEIYERPIVTISGDSMLCSSDIRTTLTASGGVSYTWSNFATTSQIEAGLGDYMVAVTDINGCENTASISIVEARLPSLIVIDSLSCEEDSDKIIIETELGNVLTASLGTITSNVENEKQIFTIQGFDDLPDASPLSVEVIVSDPVSNCTNVHVFLLPDCACPPIDAPSGFELQYCEGSALPLLSSDAPEGLELCWYDVPTAGTPLFKNDGFAALAAGTYYIEYRDLITACTSSRTRIDVIEEALPSINFTGDTEICVGELAEICVETDSEFPIYSWSNGASNSCVNLERGEYLLVLTDPVTGCDNTAEVVIFENEPIQIFQEEIICSPEEAGIETEIFQDINGCDSLIITTQYTLEPNPENCFSMYVPNVFSPNGDGVNDKFEISINAPHFETGRIQVFNRAGNLVFESDNLDIFWDGKYQGKVLNNSVFIYSIEIEMKNGKTYIDTGEITILH